jgi:protein TonB
MLGLLLAALHHARAATLQLQPPAPSTTQIFWLSEPGPGGGGGGGGNRMQEPPRPAELPGHDAITVPARKPPAMAAPPKIADDPPVVPQLNIPVTTLAAATEALPGSVEAPHGPPTASQGPGGGGGSGNGDGTGDGPGRGPGLGPGDGAGTDGGPYQPGNGVTMPVEIHKGVPRYTTDAMRARIQGSIMVECIVRTDGVCDRIRDRIRVLRSFNPAFGLDEEAIKAAAQWRFRPGMRRGEPVPVLVTMEIAFALR